jgi:glycolate oxidase iron-sulfur subunit
MQTIIHPNLQNIEMVSEAEEILRSCVHCGFCNAVCPTYQLLGDELDGPRGRIYLIKNLLEEDRISDQSAVHIDRCLTCRSCETTCPSGVQYGRLLDIGREMIKDRVTLPFHRRAISWALRTLIPRKALFSFLLRLGQLLRPLLPKTVAKEIPVKNDWVNPAPVKKQTFAREVLLLKGCVQQAATPGVNAAIERLLAVNGVGVRYLETEGCCGALDYHLSAHQKAIARIKSLVDQLYQQLDSVDCILSSASGCGVTIKDYPEILKYEDRYTDKAKRVAEQVKDVSEYLAQFDFDCGEIKVAVHTPCSLQHGQKLPQALESIMMKAGADLIDVEDKHLCCGSAGTYSILHPDIAGELTGRKVDQLEKNSPDVIVTANVGCQLQLQSRSKTKVMHWVELLASRLP